ncbi:MAG TPA: DUF885 domain-containing protein [Longimicrobiales bacterium]
MSTFNRLVEEFFAYWWRTHPSQATAVGIHTYDGELERADPAALAERRRHVREYLRAFEQAVPRDAGEALDRELVLGQLRWYLMDLEEVRTHARNPLLYLEQPLESLYLMAVREHAPAGERALQATERLSALPRLLGEARENLTEAAPVLVEAAAAVARSGVELLDRVLPLYLGEALADDPRQFARWENALRGAGAALLDYARWLEDELAPRATSGFALGKVAFEAKLRHVHGLAYTVDELAAYGEALRRETQKELEALAAELGQGRGWKEWVEVLREEHPPADELIETYAREVQRARDFILERDLVGIPPTEALAVVPTPEYLRPLIPSAAYVPPAPHEVEQQGFFFVTPPDNGELLREHSRYGIPITALHEAYPGHHLQFTWACRADTEPRRVFWTPVFAEGWALYCEEMMWEQGFYADPRERLLQLQNLLWRACRVVVDVGLHARGWSTDRAVAYLVEEAGLERFHAEIEVRRYCAEPTQPLSYAVGKRELLRLRERFRARQGEAFELRDFHDRVLSWGTIPPSLIARALGLA